MVHGSYGKSENASLDKFIFENKLIWIPYDQFKDVKYLDEGGFGTIYKAIWLPGNDYNEVVLKCPNYLNENLDEFLNEWNYHGKCLDSTIIIKLYGFTKDPNTSKYMVVMDYANKGSLRSNLTKIVNNNWNEKLRMLFEIIYGLSEIHKQDLIHCDFHDGNILNHRKDQVFISDLGLCRPVTSSLEENEIFGVVPFMAPEILRGDPYTPASDIYSFSMIMWEFTSGVQPFKDIAHDVGLCISICKGERPDIIENTPQCYADLMKRCWNENPLERPSAGEIVQIMMEWIFRDCSTIISEELESNIIEFISAPIGNNNLAVGIHPQAFYTSRILDFTSKELIERLESKERESFMIE
ncbi:kinase-like domain-containing protein [Rhizophagus clarus]|nr:kinase-like domain-containing protein [Rhizophagus clarus]